MAKSVTKEALEQMVTLQKGYIDKGDRDNAVNIATLGKQVSQIDVLAQDNAVNIATLGEQVDQIDVLAQDNAVNIATLGKQVSQIDVLAQTIDVLAGYNSVVGDFPKGTPDYVANDVWGHPKNLLKLWVPVLMDTTDNTGTTTKAKRLRRNNLLRFEDGSFAPVVGITQAMYDECMTNDLYVFEGGDYTQVYAAGEYDAAVQWEADKALIKASQELPTLYKKEGDFVAISHRLRPWETTETKYTIGVANLIDLYLADNQMGTSGKYIKGIFFNGSPYDGIEISKWKLPPTAIGPCPITTIQEGNVVKARNFFYLYQGITNCRSNKGLLTVNPFYEADRTYPRTNDVDQANNMKYARNNNADANASYPFAEGGHFAWNVFITALELAAKTRYIHAENLFGSGISTNYGTSAANFYTSGGIRFREAGVENAAWNYRTWGSDSAPLQYNANGNTTLMARLMTEYEPIEQCMESQLAASMAVELGINPTMDGGNGTTPITFEFYGNTYYYMNVDGFDGLQEGDMNVRVYKLLHANVEAFKGESWTPGQAQTWDMEIVLRMSLFNGVNLCGDILAYNGGGLEMVITPNEADRTADEIKLYVEPDQTKWHNVTDLETPADSKFAFEDSYKLMATVTNLGDGYTLTREGYTPWKIAEAASVAQGECYYQASYRWWSGTNRIRLSSIFRGEANFDYCSPRILRASKADTGGYCSGSAQTLVEFV